MNIRALRYFVETVKHQSFTKAAAHLGVTQSTVSKMVRQLEDEFGETLIIRDAKQFLLSDTAKVIMERGLAILRDIEQLRAEVRATQSLQQGVLRLGIPPMINLLFTEVLQEFSQLYPQIQLHIRELPGPAIEQQVASGELEMGFSILPVASELDVSSTTVASHTVWALASGHTFKEKKEKIKFSELAALPLIFLNDDFGLTRLLRHTFSTMGITPNVVAQSSQWDWIASMATSGLGVALLPEPFLSRLQHPPAQMAQIIEPTLKWEVVHVWNSSYLSLAAKAWLSCCETVLGGQWIPDSLKED